MIGVKSILAVIGVSAVLIAGLVVWDQSSSSSSTLRTTNTETFNGPLTAAEQRVADSEPSNDMNPHAQITTNHGVITLELYRDRMPITVENFTKLATDGFYDDTKFHRIIDGFMIQGGDPNTRSENTATYGTGGPGYTIQDEFVSGEGLSNVRGTIAMANTGQPNSGGSQFFINLVDNTGLDFDKEPLSSKHPVFGRVIDGMEVVDAISRVETGTRDIPIDPVVIQSIEIVEQGE